MKQSRARPQKRLDPREQLRREVNRAKREALEAEYAFQVKAHRLPGPERQAKFHPNRSYRADFLWRSPGLIVEIDGGTYRQGRHTRGAGYGEDRRRDAEALLLGFVVLRLCAEHVASGEGIEWTKQLLAKLPSLEARQMAAAALRGVRP